jgi:Zn-dependent M32 family carboxypeptidase
MNELSELHRRAREIADLNGIGGLLLWDQNTMMPPGGADARADQFEALERIQHKSLTDPQLGRILEELEPWAASEDPDSDDVRLIAVLKRDHEKAVRVPTELAAEMSGASAHAQQSWLEAREEADFKPFAPALEHLLELQQRYIACFDDSGEYAHPYDILLDDYEPGLTTEELRGLFAHLQEELVPLVSAAAAAILSRSPRGATTSASAPHASRLRKAPSTPSNCAITVGRSPSSTIRYHGASSGKSGTARSGGDASGTVAAASTTASRRSSRSSNCSSRRRC